MNIWTKLAMFSFFETDRLYLRPFFFSDSQDFYEIASNPENLQFIFPTQASLEESQYALANYFMKSPLGVWAICDQKNQQMIGSIKFEKLDEMGVRMTISEDSIFVEEQSNLKAINIKTAPYPGFATDLQQPITPLLLTAEGRGTIIDTIYEKRVNHVFELAKMDADISTTNGHILYTGGRGLRGASVKATDLRAGAALVIAGLMAEGQTEITNIEFILRGYSDIIEKLRNLGADIRLVED